MNRRETHIKSIARAAGTSYSLARTVLACAAVVFLEAHSALADVLPPPRMTLLESLSPTTRAKVVMTLLGLVLLGLTLLAMTWWAGRYIRRAVRKPLKPMTNHQYDWAAKPIVPKPDSPPPPSSDLV